MTTPADFAQTLGISSEPDGYSLGPFTDEEDTALLSFMQRMPTHSFDLQTKAFWTEFVASNFPQFVHSYLHRSFVVLPGCVIGLFDYTIWVAHAVRYAVNYGHFVRAREDGLAALWTTTVERLSLVDTKCLISDPNADAEEGFQEDRETFEWLFRLWQTLESTLSIWLPVGFRVPLPDPATILRLQALLPFISSESNIVQRWETVDEPLLTYLDDFLRYANHVINDDIGFAITSDMKEELLGTDRPWWSCEALVDEVVEEGSCSVGIEETTGPREDVDVQSMPICSILLASTSKASLENSQAGLLQTSLVDFPSVARKRKVTTNYPTLIFALSLGVASGPSLSTRRPSLRSHLNLELRLDEMFDDVLPRSLSVSHSKSTRFLLLLSSLVFRSKISLLTN